MVLLHYRAAYAASDTSRHLNEALMNISAFNIPESGNAVFNAVNGHIGVVRILCRHRFEYSARGREQSCAAVFIGILLLFKLNMLLIEPSSQLIKCQYGIDYSFIKLSFVLFCHAGPDKDGLCVGITPFNILAVSLHRRKNIGKVREVIREILLYQQIDRMTA